VNYYNEYDPRAAAWLRELIKEGHIPKGYIDERSITEVNPKDLAGFTQCHFFAGVGGWSVALQLAGWPENRSCWSGSAPCQPFSAAGKGLAQKDDRHLWPHFFRLIRECRPNCVFGEQVESAIGHGWLDGICADLEGEGYAVGQAVLGAHSVGAPHIRQRLYWVADNSGNGWQQRWSEPDGRGVVGDGASCGLEHPEGSGRQNLLVSGQEVVQQGIDGRCAVGGRMAVTDGWDAGAERQQRSGEQRQQPQDGGLGGGLAHHHHQGREGRNGAELPKCAEQRTPWSSGAYRWINCRDGKLRRIPIEPEFFPLAHGVPGRVGLLRGYGNAIVPQVAAQFIQAYLEAKTEIAEVAFLE
jgi:DNA (cytosine-5)-methyltransferase 1